MYANRDDFDHRPYRAQLNPDFRRRVLAERKQKEAEEKRIAAKARIEQKRHELLEAARENTERRNELLRVKAEVAATNRELQDLRRIADEQANEIAQFVAQRTATQRELNTMTFASIEAIACRVFGTTRTELRSQRRNREICFARQFIMYWAARRTKLSMPKIGQLLGGRDHTTALSGKKAYVEKRAKMGRTLRPAR